MVRKSSLSIDDLKIFNDKNFLLLNKEDQVLRLLENKLFRRAILVSSPSLFLSCQNIYDKKIKDIKNIHASILKYYVRMCTRPTPFGMFSGMNIIDNTGESMNTFKKKTVCTEISQEWFYYFVKLLLKYDELYPLLSFCTNKNILIKESNISIYFNPGEKNNQKETSIIKNDLNLVFLEFLKEPRDFEEIIHYFYNNNINIPQKDLIYYLKKLVNKNFIVTNIQFSTLENYTYEFFEKKLKNIKSLNHLMEIISRLHNFTKKDFDIDEYLECLKLSQQLIPNIIPFQVDTIFNENVFIDNFIEDDLKEIGLMYYIFNEKLSSNTTYNDVITELISNYGVNTEVSIMKMLYDYKYLDLSKYFNNEGSKTSSFNEFLINIMSKNNKTIVLDNYINTKDFTINKPASFDLYFIIHKDKKGNTTYFPSGNVISNESHKTYGRFLKYFDNLSLSLANEKESLLEKCFPEKKIVNLSYLPKDYKAVNVMKTKKLYKNNFIFDAFEFEKMKNNELTIYSDSRNLSLRAGNKDTHFFVSHMANYEMNAPKIVKMLLDISSNSYLKCYPFDNDVLSNIDYFPRIQYKNYVLKLEKWKFKRSFSSMNVILNLYDKGFVKRFLNIINYDNYILIDLKSEISKGILEKELRKKEGFIELEEADHLIDNNSYYRGLEFIAPINIYNEKKEKEKDNKLILKYDNEIEKRKVNISDGLIYFKIYCDPSYNDELIKDIYGFLKTLKIKKYFFIRYFDPDNHIRLRVFSDEENLVKDLKIFKHISNLDYVNRIEISEYNREVERYGGVKNIVLAEDIFVNETKFIEDIINTNKDVFKYAFCIAINYFNLFFNELDKKEQLEMFEVKLNKDDYSFYRNNFKKNEDLFNIKSLVDQKFNNTRLKESLINYKYSLDNSTYSLLFIYYNLTHMMYNRLGINNQDEEKINKCIYNYFKEEFYKWKK